MKERKVPKGRIVAWLAGGFTLGISIFSFIKPLPETESVFCIGAIALAAAIVRKLAWKKWLQIFSLILLGTSIGMWRYGLSEPSLTPAHISYYNGQEAAFSGIISREPVDKGDGWQLTVSVSEMSVIDRRAGRQDKVENEPARKSVHGLVLVSVPSFPFYGYGDSLHIACRLEKPENKEFAYDRYLARYGIYSLCSRARISIKGRGQRNAPYAALLRVKQRSYALAQAYMPEPTASLALPVVFGGGQGIDDDITESFRRTGLTHIMAVSGFNVSLLAILLGFGFMALGVSRRSAFFATSFVIAGYVLIVGAPASAVRAGVMSIFLLLALTLGRLVSLPRSVLLVAAMTLIVNPRLLRDDIGWQLSFLALLGLMYVLPYLEKWSLWLTKGKYKALITALMATVAAQIATAPVILYNFGNFSLIAPLANLLVVWVVPVLTISMMAALPLAALFPSLGTLFFFPSWVMVKYIFFIVQFLSGFAWAAVERSN